MINILCSVTRITNVFFYLACQDIIKRCDISVLRTLSFFLFLLFMDGIWLYTPLPLYFFIIFLIPVKPWCILLNFIFDFFLKLIGKLHRLALIFDLFALFTYCIHKRGKIVLFLLWWWTWFHSRTIILAR